MQAVLGGGISGLSAAFYLLKSGTKSKVLILESGERVGGWIWSKNKNGVLFEQGPRTIRPRFQSGLNTLQLVEDLNIPHLVTGVPSSHPAAKNRMIFVGGKLHTLPSSLLQLFIRQPPFSKPLAAALIHDLKANKKILEDESIYSFVDRRFGKELAEYAISPMICGICAGDAKEISVKFLAKSLFEWEQRYGSITKGLIASLWAKQKMPSPPEPSADSLAWKAKQEKWSVWSLKGGLEILPQTLLKQVTSQGAEVQLNATCTKITFQHEGALLFMGDRKVHVDNIISTIPASRLALLVAHQHPDLSKELSKIPTVTVAVVNLAFKGNVLSHNAFGFLIPPSEKKSILGVIFDTCSFPQQDLTVLTVMMGGRWFEPRLGADPTPDNLLATALTEVRSILKINQDLYEHHVSILKDCIPQYIVGHYERVKRIREYIEKRNLPLFLAGSSFDGVGVNDVILSAKQAVTVSNSK